MRAAGLMGQLRIALRAYASEGHRPDAVLSRASRFLAGLTDAYDDAAGDRAPRVRDLPVRGGRPGDRHPGHRPRRATPTRWSGMADGTVLIRPTGGGLPLGIDPDADYPTTRLVLEPGETMLLCTDGLIETGGHDLDTGWDAAPAGPGGARAATWRSWPTPWSRPCTGPTSHHTTGPLADRREDDIAVLLLRRGTRRGTARRGPAPVRRTVLTVAQAEPERIAAARQQLRELLHDWADPDQVDSAVLMVSEMVTNVLVHTDGDALLVAEVTGERGERRLRVEVADAQRRTAAQAAARRDGVRRAGPGADGDAGGRVGRGSAGRGQVDLVRAARVVGRRPARSGGRGSGLSAGRLACRVVACRTGRSAGRAGGRPGGFGSRAERLRSSPQDAEGRRAHGTASSMPRMPATLAPAVSAIMTIAGCICTVRLWITGWSTCPSSTCTASTTPSAHSAITNPRSASATRTATAPERKAPRYGMYAPTKTSAPEPDRARHVAGSAGRR